MKPAELLADRLAPLAPPAFVRAIRRVRPGPYSASGNYASFQEALRATGSRGYEEDAVVQTAVERHNRALAAREGGDAGQGPLRIQAFVARALTRTTGDMFRVLDFGGALGVHHLAAEPLLGAARADRSIEWLVCETPAMAEAGHREFASDEVSFISDLGSAAGGWNLVLASGSLQYVPDPVSIFDRLRQLDHDLLALDRLPLLHADRDRLAVQRTRDLSGRALRYPVWLLSRERWLGLFRQRHDVIASWRVAEDELPVAGANPRQASGILLRCR
jgi:putative methyltransferase (TIGR04325 family)